MTLGFIRRPEGIEVLFGEQERRVVALALQLVEGVDATDTDDPAAARLNYRAHPDEPEADERFRRLTAQLLDDARAEDRRRFADTLRQDRLDIEEAEAWIRVIGEARLVLASRLGITEDGWEDGMDPATASPQMLLLHVLGQVQDGLVQALLE